MSNVKNAYRKGKTRFGLFTDFLAEFEISYSVLKHLSIRNIVTADKNYNFQWYLVLVKRYFIQKVMK